MNGPPAQGGSGTTLAGVETRYEPVLERAETMLDEVDAALGRLAEGSYGLCASCGGRIADERLAAMPTALACELHAV